MILAKTEVREKRKSICENCEHNRKPYEICKLCKCFIPAKTSLKSAACPIGKW